VGFVSPITTADNLGNRQVDRDYYTTYGTEFRLLTDYRWFGLNNSLAAGLRYFKGQIDRKQMGRGDFGREMSYDLANELFPRDLDFNNINRAAFAENIFRINKKLLFTAGLRVENIQSQMEGQFNVVNGQALNLKPETRQRNFLLFGFGAEYHITTRSEFYSNFSQAYRPV
jgi:Fe(3+) dicitrate transport protein